MSLRSETELATVQDLGHFFVLGNGLGSVADIIRFARFAFCRSPVKKHFGSLTQSKSLVPIGFRNLCLLVHSLILYEGNNGSLECVIVQKNLI